MNKNYIDDKFIHLERDICKNCGKEFSLNNYRYNKRLENEISTNICPDCNRKIEHRFVCDNCHREFILGKNGYNRRKRLNIPFNICTFCFNSQNKEYLNENFIPIKIITKNDHSVRIFKCNSCGKEYELNDKQFYQRKKRNNPNLCFECMYIYKCNTVNEKNRNRSPEEKTRINKILSEKAIKRLSLLSVEEKKRRANLGVSKRNYEEINRKRNETIERKKEQEIEELKRISREAYYLKKEELSKFAKDRYAKIPDEVKEERARKISKSKYVFWEDKDEEYRKKNTENAIIAGNEYRNNLTDEERKSIGEKLGKKFWKEMTDEKFQDWDKKRRKGLNKYYHDDINTTLNKNELAFANELNKYNIKHDWQWENSLIKNGFKEAFPYNHVTGSSYVSETHAWDFILYLNRNTILVDIDGSKHDPEKITYKVTDDHGRRYYQIDQIKFYDAQRIYKTDGLDAYVIEVYDDKFEDDSKVLELNTNRYMSYREFISYILLADSNDEELNNVMKVG